jgi:hypothetical protein
VSQTYTSDTLRVSHGEITSHTTPSDINVLSAQARWQGIDVTETETNKHTRVNISNIYDITGTQETDITWPDTYNDEDYQYNEAMNYMSQGDKDASNEMEFWAWWEYDSSTDDKSTADYHAHQTSDVLKFTSLSKDLRTKTGHARIEVINGEWWIENEFQTHYETTTSTTYHTKDPYVTRDVDASYSGTLSDGEWSTWQTMTGFVEGTNEFYHNISGSNEAYFEFEYTYEEVYPTVQKQFRLYDVDQNAIHTVALADPSDSQLDYNHHRYALNGTVYALDVVDPSDESAINWVKWYHPTHGEYCPRAYDTIQL